MTMKQRLQGCALKMDRGAMSEGRQVASRRQKMPERLIQVIAGKYVTAPWEGQGIKKSDPADGELFFMITPVADGEGVLPHALSAG